MTPRTLATPSASEPSLPEAVKTRFNRTGVALALAVLGLFLVALWVWNKGMEQRAIRHLPEQERRALYDRTLRTLQAPCGSGERLPGLEAFCREQAAFIVEFPECDAECAALARGQTSRPTK